MSQVAADVAVAALRSSFELLHDLVADLDDSQLDIAAYPTDWTVADVMSHIGSGATIAMRHLQNGIDRAQTPMGFLEDTWAEWNAKSPREQHEGALVADRAQIERFESMTDDERARFQFSLHAIPFDFARFVMLRLNEHLLHTWDIQVALEPGALLQPEGVALVIDSLELVANHTAKPTGASRLITVATTDPERRFTIDLASDTAPFAAGGGSAPDITLTSEAFIRLVYGRLDATDGGPQVVGVLRQVFPGF